MRSLRGSWFLSILIILRFFIFDNSCTQGKCQNDQRALLIQLNQSLMFTNYSPKRSSWHLNTDCCSSWQGIKCDKAGHVISLDLSSEDITGGLNDSSSLFNFQYLQSLNLADNQFWVSDARIPSGLSKLTNLHYLNLSNSAFHGQIPIEISRMTKLVTLDLSDSTDGLILSDPDFKMLTRNLTGLRILWLDHVNISSEVPEFFGEFRNLTSLHLSNCGLYGKFPQRILQLQSLRSLILSGNNFQGSLPEFPVGGQLQKLDLSNAGMVGELPNSIGNLRFLSGLRLSSGDSATGYNGSIPTSLSKLNQLQFLDLSSNMLQGKNPILSSSAFFLDYSFNNFTSLIQNISHYVTNAFYFSISSNQINGEIPTSICEGEVVDYEDGRTSQIEYLDLSHNNLSGKIPPCLLSPQPGLLQLKVLDLRRNNLEGVIPDTQKSCKLEKLDLNGNKLKGRLPGSLAYCTTLKILDVGNNQLSGTFPSRLGSMPQLRALVLRSNKLNGPWGSKESECNFPMLQIIDISFNNFSGILSKKCFSSWKFMTVYQRPYKTIVEEALEDLDDGVLGFDVEFNDVKYKETMAITLKGVNMEVGQILYNFTSIDFSNNQFQGEIPESIGNLKLLYTLNLSSNAFTGPIPSIIGNLTHLESLDFSRNNLIGEIPVQLAGLSSLAVLNLSYNKLAGEIPSGSQLQTFDSSAFEGNDGLCGFPLAKNSTCVAESPTNVLGSEDKFDWALFVATFLGFVVGASMVIAPQYFWRKGREWVNERINKILNIA